MTLRPLPPGMPPLTMRGLNDLIYRAPRACGDEPELFIGPDDETPAEHAERVASARALCEDCPVRLACLARALRHKEEYGVWAGFDAEAGELAYLHNIARLMVRPRRTTPPEVAA